MIKSVDTLVLIGALGYLLTLRRFRSGNSPQSETLTPVS